MYLKYYQREDAFCNSAFVQLQFSDDTSDLEEELCFMAG